MDTIGIFLLINSILAVAVLQAILIKKLDFPVMIKFENQKDLINFALKVNEKYDSRIPISHLEDNNGEHELDLLLSLKISFRKCQKRYGITKSSNHW